jgi:hypothetical protein
MRIALGAVACSGIRAHMGGDIQAAVEQAVLHYTGRLRAGRPPIGLPRFADDGATPIPEVVLDLTLPPEVGELLEREAQRQGVAVERLVAHSVLIYLAELDFLEAPPSDAGAEDQER